MSERMEYDQSGRITSRIFADGKSWSYTYLEKVRMLLPLRDGAFEAHGLNFFDVSTAALRLRYLLVFMVQSSFPVPLRCT